ncbi:MAG: DUF1772 domain-containing protein [Woeseiaceae bacterium]|nr:DUF1772 domain-containing protein [Woeseiaceae bacterium]
MNLMTIAVLAALLGAGLIGGVFFAFSSFIMKALARRPSPEGIAAMQSINIVVINPVFLGAFMGTAAISVIIAVLAVLGWGSPSAAYFLAGALLYVIGTFFVTIFGNVPFNNKLAEVSATDPGAVAVWEEYLRTWTLLNTIRTVAAAAATLAFALGLMVQGTIA